MTAIEGAIKEAVEKGDYKESLEIDKIELFPEFAPGNPDFKRVARVHVHHANMNLDYSVDEILLDPLFWQALGKARGWRDDSTECNCRRNEGFHIRTCPRWDGNDDWKEVWHLFIDHLASGQDAESFFKTLV